MKIPSFLSFVNGARRVRSYAARLENCL